MRSKINEDMVYQKLYKYYSGKPNYNSATQVISKSHLVMTSLITTGQTNAVFNINATTGGATQQAWEQRLQQTDCFTISRIGIYGFGLIGSSTGPAGTTGYMYWTYAPYQMSSTFIAVQNIWQSGAMTATLNGRQYIKGWLTNDHYYSPRTQDGPFQAITTSGTPNNGTIANLELGDNGVLDCEPTITFSGSWNNQIQIQWTNGISISPVTNFVYVGDANDVYININYINMKLSGLLAQNTSSILGNDFSM